MNKTIKIAALISGIVLTTLASAAPLYQTSTIDIGVENEVGLTSTTVTAGKVFTLSGNMDNALCANCAITATGNNQGSPKTANDNAIALNAKEGEPFTGSITIPLTIQANVPDKGNETITTSSVINFTGVGGFMMNFAGNNPLVSKTDPNLQCEVNTEGETTKTGMLIPLILVQCAEL